VGTRPTTSPEAEVYRELVAPRSPAPKRGSLLKRGALGITTVAVAGWMWRRNKERKT
jgi:hypothetical protein